MLKGQKTRSEAHELIVILYDKRSRTKEEERQLEVLLKAERAKVAAKKAEAAAAKMLGAKNDTERKARNHRLIQQGLLLDLAGLDEWDRGLLLGALLSMAKSDSITPEKKVDWKRAGDALLAEKGETASLKQVKKNLVGEALAALNG